MRVSVVIPCHNSLRYLPETLDSVLDQQLPARVDGPLEVVLVDDGGSDSLTEWAAARGDDRVRVLRQDNAGVSAARNAGIAAATGDLIAFCDSDDVWLPTTVADLTDCFAGDPAIGLAYGWYDVVDAAGAPTGRVYRSDWHGDVWERLVTRNVVGASGVMVRRDVLDEVGVFAVNRDRFRVDVEDWELWIRIAARWPVGVAETVVYHYRRHDQNSSTDVDSLDAAYRNLLDVVFADVSPERARLRPHATASIEMILAWQSLNDRQDPRRALQYLRSASTHSPELRRTPGYWRLRAAASVLSLTGEPGYAAVRSANTAARLARAKLPGRG